MYYFHASQTPDLTLLEPRVSNHGKPLIYASCKRENVLVYLSNAVEKHCREVGFDHPGPWRKWASYGFKNGLLVLEEYWPDATRETYQGVSGYVYTVEGAFTPQADIPDAFTTGEPAGVLACEFIPDAYEALLQAEKEGKLLLKSYADNSEKTLRWLEQITLAEYEEAADHPEYQRFLLDKFPDYLQKITPFSKNGRNDLY